MGHTAQVGQLPPLPADTASYADRFGVYVQGTWRKASMERGPTRIVCLTEETTEWLYRERSWRPGGSP